MGIFLWLVYGILVKDLPLIIANVITLLFTSTILILKMALLPTEWVKRAGFSC
jgi:MtN3 and saliva related transmembrane protein